MWTAENEDGGGRVSRGADDNKEGYSVQTTGQSTTLSLQSFVRSSGFFSSFSILDHCSQPFEDPYAARQ